MNDQPAAPSTPPAPAVSITPPGAIVVNPPTYDAHPTLSEAEAKTMADWARQDVASGKLTPEAAAKVFDQLGTPADQRVTPIDLRTDQVKLLDTLSPVAKPEEFRISYVDPGQPAPR